MRKRVVDPSEIIVEQRRGTVNEDTKHVNPWVRFLARFFDYSLFFLLLWLLRHLTQGRLPLGHYEQLVPFEFFVWIPIEAALLTWWGTTPGKFFLKIKIRHGAKAKFDYGTAFKRSFHVWFRGLGMGIPVINLLCMIVAYHRLKVFHKTSWDRDDHILITHSPMGKWRLVVAALVIVSSFSFYFHDKQTKMAHERVV